MFAHLIFVVLALMAPASAYRTFYLTVLNQYPGTAYIILPWEMWGYGSQPANSPGEWNNGWNVAAIYNVTGPNSFNQLVIPLYFALTSKSSHILRVSKTYAGAQNNDNSIACGGLPITITQTTPNALSITVASDTTSTPPFYYCSNIVVS